MNKDLVQRPLTAALLLVGFVLIYEVAKIGNWDTLVWAALLFLCLDVEKDRTDSSWLKFLPWGLLILGASTYIYYRANTYWWVVADWQMNKVFHLWNWDATFARIPFNDPGWIRALLPSQWLTAKLAWVYNYGFEFSIFAASIRSFMARDWRKMLKYALATHVLQTPLIIPFYNTIELHEVWWVKKLPDLLGRTNWMDAYHLKLNAQNCFPSMHTSIGIVVLLLALREKGPIFKWAMAAYCGTLIFSTLYLRIHWTIDVLGGLVFGYAVLKLTDFLMDSLPGRLKRRFSKAKSTTAAAV